MTLSVAAAITPPPLGVAAPDPAACFAAFEPTTLDALGGAALADRLDVKFLVPIGALPTLLAPWTDRYRVLEVAGHRVSRYRTTYYDTDALRLYHDHLAGRAPRQKLRVREYLDSGSRFLELKEKTARGRTIKQRRPLAEDASPLSGLGELPLAPALHGVPLSASLEVCYRRATLVARESAERITFDFDLAFRRGVDVVQHGAAVVVEVKRASRGRSPFLDAARHWSRHTVGLSKYGMGLAALVPGIRRHRHLPALRRIGSLDVAG
jgi:hypothetical protein